jgi:hypothetical protein
VAVRSVGLRPLVCWDCGFDSHRCHKCLSLASVVNKRSVCWADLSSSGVLPSVCVSFVMCVCVCGVCVCGVCVCVCVCVVCDVCGVCVWCGVCVCVCVCVCVVCKSGE